MTTPGMSARGTSSQGSSSPEQLPLDLGHRTALGQEDFLVAPCNEKAVAWLDRWPEWSAPGLVIHGPPGCGKTHLAHVWLSRSQAVLLSPESLLNDDPPDLLGEKTSAIIEDADRAVGSAVRERTLLHLHNMLQERQGCLLLTAVTPVAGWPTGLPDLRSRLAALPAVDVGTPDDALIGAVLVKMFSDRQLQVGQDVITYLLTRMERSFSSARRIVAALDSQALAAKRRITVPFVAEVLAGL